MKKLKLALIGLLFSLVANANGELAQFDRIVLTLVDGTSYEIPINSGSYIYSYVEGTGIAAKQVIEIKGDNCKYKFDRDEISTLKCIEIIAGIENVTADDVEKLRIEDGKIIIHPSLEGENLAVYDLAGRLVEYTTIESNQLQLSLDYLPTGVYIVKAKECSIKVAVK